ncbi:uncharacterized protein LOC133785811 [Humulus lupulus]|uniref:uncharacterized protein LOC133785811 n=1 Tax=Humulus lupulus TaxID=3486 RepID=UPI002B40B3FB|nr:uncharacterized protein LOC133785811 [Humulus lupulus]
MFLSFFCYGIKEQLKASSMARTRKSSTFIRDPPEAPMNNDHRPPPPEDPPAPTVHNNGGQTSASNRFAPLETQDRATHEDARNPYFLGNGDHLGIILDSPPLTDKIFQQWRWDFMLSIWAKNKKGFLNGKLPQPHPSDPNYNAWHQCDQMIMSWIIHLVSPDIKSSIMFLDSAAAMWEQLNNRFNQGNGPRIFELRQTLIRLHQGDDFVLQFLTGLNESYHAVIDPFPSLSKGFSMIVQEERQRNLGPSNNPNLVAASTNTQLPNLTPNFLAASTTTQIALHLNKMIGIAERIGHLYFLQKNPHFLHSCSSVQSQNSCKDVHKWHTRLGHPSLLVTNSLNKDLNFLPSTFSARCNICHLAKQKKLPFISQNNIAPVAFDLVHMDIWGPFHTISIEGFRFFLTIVDDHTRFTWVYMLKSKSDVQFLIPQFFSYISTHFSATIKALRCDNAKELNMTSFYAKGIQ